MASKEGQALALRQEYMACIKLANETDSKKEDNHLRGEARIALDSLFKVCPHIHTVCLRSEHEGFQSMDWDDAHKEDRICLCCGEEESAWNPDWKILTATPFARFESDCPGQIKDPLSYLLTEVVDIAETKGYCYSGSVKMK
jgi:hypothetical protein